ncbi:MAG: lytic transglycosylase domain-containing protein [Cyanobacteria bacterium HKST-UBA06]|nr:lytic transglycosylase domain-containing protein [Cyanobacteria bacterium HKST-UBA04]MCA9807725.1 lytic transglycosylase domain-containing protein [Cyanobacteria bacterium HKST-UBA06]MCA9842484.1 lytic transglycosylase domain-containing protein [Cyanobacteria bacterium HKST-UBA03]
MLPKSLFTHTAASLTALVLLTTTLPLPAMATVATEDSLLDVLAQPTPAVQHTTATRLAVPYSHTTTTDKSALILPDLEPASVSASATTRFGAPGIEDTPRLGTLDTRSDEPLPSELTGDDYLFLFKDSGDESPHRSLRERLLGSHSPRLPKLSFAPQSLARPFIPGILRQDNGTAKDQQARRRNVPEQNGPSYHTASGYAPAMPPNAESMPASLSSMPMTGSLATIDRAIRTYNTRLSEYEVVEINTELHEVSRQFHLDPHLLASLIAVESSFRPQAVSRTGAIGLGQLKPKTAQWLGVNNPWDPHQNMYGAAKYLRYLLNRFDGSTTKALAAYYQGQGAIEREGINSDGHYYVGKIQKAYKEITNTTLGYKHL